MFQRFRGSFDPETLLTLGQAFDLAWDYIEKSGACVFANPDEGRHRLVSALVSLAQGGEANKIALANKAIAQLCNPKETPPSGVTQAIWPTDKHF